MVQPVIPYVVDGRWYTPDGFLLSGCTDMDEARRRTAARAEFLERIDAAVQVHAAAPPSADGATPYTPVDEPPDQCTRVHAWSVLIPAAVAVVLGALGLGAVHLAVGRPTPDPAPTATARPAPIQCDVPAQVGDRQVITIERTAERLLVRCLSINSWRTPERNK